MKKEIEAAIKQMAEKCDAKVTSTEAMQYTQAALNLAHVLQVLKQAE